MPFLTYPDLLQLKKELEGTSVEIVTLADEGDTEAISRGSDTSEKVDVHRHLEPSLFERFAATSRLVPDYLKGSATEADTRYIKGAIVKVTSAEDISRVVAFATKRYIPFTVDSGGFNTRGASSTYGGIVISLQRMRTVTVDEDNQTVTVQGGAIWRDVDTAAAAHGMAVVSATANHLSVGGTTLGGGFGWLSGRYGLAIDNLLSTKIVLADASIVTASETQHPDLFWAVRGAGQAFGVVTEFSFKTHPQKDDVFAGILMFRGHNLEKIVEFANGFEAITDGNQAFFFGFTDYKQETAILVVLFYNGSQEAAMAFFEPILSLGPELNDCQVMPYSEATDIVNIAARSSGRKRISGTSIKPPLNARLIRGLYYDFDSIMSAYPNVGNSLLVFEVISYREIITTPTHATAYANRGKSYNVASMFCWQSENLDARMRLLQQNMITKVRQLYFPDHDEGAQLYANYAGYAANAKDLFGENLYRLRELKKLYDPKNVFRKWHDLLLETGPPA